MYQNKRLVIVGRVARAIDDVTRLLEGAGYIVTVTTDDSVAIDMVGNSDYAALLIGGDVPQADQRYIATQVRLRNPSVAVLIVNSPRSVLTQLSQVLPG